jgi:transcription initiation factor TFIID subunit TAF12
MMVKDTTFGNIGKREMFQLRVYIENRIEILEKLARKAKLIFQNWEEEGIEQDIEDLMWDICIAFDECITCPACFFCRKRNDR